jgi:Lipocalin-like domain
MEAAGMDVLEILRESCRKPPPSNVKGAFMAAIPSQDLLVGTWELLSREEVTLEGQRRIDPILGSNPVAYLMYDAAGHFAVQFMRRDRGPAEKAAGQSPANGAMNGYDAYFGRYIVEKGTVTQELVGALSPGDVGKVVTRHFHIDGNELVIRLQTAGSDGEPVTRTLKWRRVA